MNFRAELDKRNDNVANEHAYVGDMQHFQTACHSADELRLQLIL